MRNGWFGPKKIGWGVSPRSWQGWVVTAIFIAILAASMRWLRPYLEQNTGWPPMALGLAIVGGWLAVYLGVIWLTYDRSESRS